MATATRTLTHDTLNSRLTGVLLEPETVSGTGVVQFRGIKFGNVSSRFARSTPVDNYPPELDCTKFGPIAPQVPQPQAETVLFAIPPEQSKKVDYLTIDEFECLNLIVTAPETALKASQEGPSSLLPVFVNIHGGANRQGTANVPLYDMSLLCARSISLGKPVIMVSINYRLSIFGFGALSDGTGANNGLFDQRLALQWVKKHIRGFGGDPSRVTVAGESAGSFGLDAHLQAKGSDTSPELQIFQQAILMSGTIMSLRPRPLALVHKVTRDYGDALPGEGDPEEKLKKAGWMEIIGMLMQRGEGMWMYVEDGDFFDKQFVPYNLVPGWCEGILIGDCEYESYIFAGQVLGSPASYLISAFKSLGAPGDSLLHAYSISGDNVHTGTLRFLNDGIFVYPTERTIETWKSHNTKKHVHRYILDQRNPWKPEAHGAHHAVDMLLLWGAYTYGENPAAKKVGEAFQEDIINFVNAAGKEMGEVDERLGWGGENVRAYGGPDGFVGVVGKEEVRKRRRIGILEEVLKELGDEFISKAGGALIQTSNEAATLGVGFPLGKL